MKGSFQYLFVAPALAALAALTHPFSSALAQGTAFTYQGRLTCGALPANGSYDLTFALFDDASAGAQQGSSLTNSATAISNGLFAVTLDFGDQFPGAPRWLEIAVQTNGGMGFTTLSPRQQLTPSPYAVFANTASNLDGTLAAAQLSGPIASANLPASPAISGTVTADGFAGDGSGLTGVDAVTLNGLTSASFWQVGGNAGANPTNGAFLGTTDNLPLEIKVGGSRALRLEYALDSSFGSVVPNVIGGYAGNVVSNGFIGAAIIGGGDIAVPNRVGNNYASVLGGLGNTASGSISTAMGNGCTASGDEAIAIGHGTIASGTISTAIGDATTANGLAAVALGYKSYANGETSLAAGNYANAAYNGSFVWADDSVNAYFSDSAANQFLIRAAGGVGIGTSTPPPGGLRVHTGGLAVSGASSPNYPGAKGVFIEGGDIAAVYGFDYTAHSPLNLCLNTPGGNVGIGTTTPAYPLQVAGSCAATSFVTVSDRNAKENFQPVSAQEVLSKVAALPVSRWNYKQDKAEEHIGPMAQDFYAAFNVGPDDKHITTTDEGGVALAAIQGLNQKLEAESKAKDAEIVELKARLEKLEHLFNDRKGGAE
jgi:hypothetical protein